MPMFRKKPVMIEARRFDKIRLEDQQDLAGWCGGSLRGAGLPAKERMIEISTLEGDMRASFGDWIIKGVKGEFYPCKEDIFVATYEVDYVRHNLSMAVQKALRQCETKDGYFEQGEKIADAILARFDVRERTVGYKDMD